MVPLHISADAVGLTERSITGKVECIEKGVSFATGIAPNVIDHTQGLCIAEVRLVEGRAEVYQR